MTPNRIWEGHNGGKDCCGRKRPTCLVSFACATSSMTTFCYSRDFANALYVVSKEENRPLSMGRFWICPHSIHNRLYRDIEDMINDHLDERAPCGFQVVTRLGCCMVWARWTRGVRDEGDDGYLELGLHGGWCQRLVYRQRT